MIVPRQFRSDIECLRALAVLGVIGFHAGVPWLRGGFIGVDVFYVISGFLITQIMLRDTEGDGVSFVAFLAEFYARRVRRILPAATVVVIATLVGAAIVHNVIENAGLIADARSTSLFYSNIHFAHQAADYFNAGRAPSPYLQYWSLSLEEQFYALWPVLFFALFAIQRSRNALVVGLGMIVVASFVLDLVWTHSDPVSAFYLLPSRAWELGIGASIAAFEPRFFGIRGDVRKWLVALGLVLMVAPMFLFGSGSDFPGWRALLPTLGGASVIVAGCGLAAKLGKRSVPRRMAELIGRYSFSMYLWHWPLVAIKAERLKWVYRSWPITTVFVIGLTLPAAALTYHLIENPIRRSKFLRARPWTSLGFGAVMIALAIASTFAFARFGHDLSTPNRVASPGDQLSPTVKPTEFVPNNMVPSLADSGDREYVHCGHPCTVGSSAAHHRIVLFGNSHAGHWASAFEAASKTLDAQVEVHAPGGCTSFLIPVALLAGTDRQACDDRRRDVFAGFDAKPPDLVVLSNMSLDVFQNNHAVWEQGVRAAIRRIPKRTKVVVLSETPKADVWIPLCLSENLENTARCDVHWPDKINQRLADIASEEGAAYIDLRPLFCTATRCPAITEDTLIYGDSDHLTVEFSRRRGSWIAAALAPLLGLR